jgi:hypothetical protein
MQMQAKRPREPLHKISATTLPPCYISAFELLCIILSNFLHVTNTMPMTRKKIYVRGDSKIPIHTNWTFPPSIF